MSDTPTRADLIERLRSVDVSWSEVGEWCAEAAAALTADAERIAALEGEVERLRAELRTAKKANWFYLGDDCSSERCRFGIDECINDDFEWDNEAKGDHVLQISGARPVPDMWIALHYFTDAERDARQDDEAYTYTVHETAEEARAALKGTTHD